MDQDKVEPLVLLFDPNIILTTSLFLYTISSLASMPALNGNTLNRNPEDVLSQIKVVMIFHKKMPQSPEHEFLVIKTVDRLQNFKHFILDRTTSNRRPGQIVPNAAESETQGRRVAERLRKFLTALGDVVFRTSDPQPSFTEEFSSQPPLSHILSCADKSSLSLTETASLLSDSLDISEDSPAYDRFLGENHIDSPRWQGNTLRFFKPNNLTLFQLVVLSQAAHDLYPTYSLLKDQCYFYAGLIFAAVMEHWGVCKLEDDEMKDMANLVLDKYGNSGCWKGFKVKVIDPVDVSSLISKYENFHCETIARIKQTANASRDQSSWEKVKNLVNEEANSI